MYFLLNCFFAFLAFFVRPFYKVILGRPVVLADMEAVDTEFYNSVKYILDNDPEPLCLTFTASREFLGQVCTCTCTIHVILIEIGEFSKIGPNTLYYSTGSRAKFHQK